MKKLISVLILITFIICTPTIATSHLTPEDKELITSYVKKVKKEILETRERCDDLESDVEERVDKLEELFKDHEHGRIK